MGSTGGRRRARCCSPPAARDHRGGPAARGIDAAVAPERRCNATSDRAALVLRGAELRLAPQRSSQARPRTVRRRFHRRRASPLPREIMRHRPSPRMPGGSRTAIVSLAGAWACTACLPCWRPAGLRAAALRAPGAGWREARVDRYRGGFLLLDRLVALGYKPRPSQAPLRPNAGPAPGSRSRGACVRRRRRGRRVAAPVPLGNATVRLFADLRRAVSSRDGCPGVAQAGAARHSFDRARRWRNSSRCASTRSRSWCS